MRKIWIFAALAAALLLPCGASEIEEAAGYVALTFDDGPSGPITEALLDGLRERDASATFFLCGYRMQEYPGPLARYVQEGHEVGVHSTVHTDLTKLSPEDLRRDIQDTADAITAAIGVRPTLLRPPGGAWNERVRQEAESEGLSIVLWSVDPRDWSVRDASTVLAAMAGTVRDGDIILMHDMSRSSVEAALRLVDDLSARGYRFVTVSELSARKGQPAAPGTVIRGFSEGS